MRVKERGLIQDGVYVPYVEQSGQGTKMGEARLKTSLGMSESTKNLSSVTCSAARLAYFSQLWRWL
jgi:hypothetical protein